MPDAVSVAPHLYKVLLEYDRVRILDTRYGPGVKSEVHTHPDLVTIAMTPSKAKLSITGGQTLDIDIQPGESLFVEAQEHTVENTGTSELHAILVELK